MNCFSCKYLDKSKTEIKKIDKCNYYRYGCTKMKNIPFWISKDSDLKNGGCSTNSLKEKSYG